MVQCQTATFSISSESTNPPNQVIFFSGEMITNQVAWTAIQSINVAYDDDKSDHMTGIREIIPSIDNISGNKVSVALKFEYADKHSNHRMNGQVSILVIADVN